ncbi:BEN domain-containing protein 2 isoform X3 [Paramisgurnus dabryanus]|uniref:BEN domain-containing protein 2 isoform X3 n=1 Tax=Paramisgurnus dabryanus TaxID=90735 RepID=UPI0031F43EEC
MSIHVIRDGFISGGGSCGLKTETDASTPAMRFRGPSPLSDSMMSEAGDDGFIHEVSQDTQEGESAISPSTYGADLQRTLGEILAYCQVTYGAILKLDEKFDMLETKVANIQSLQQNPTLLSQTRVSDSFQSRTEGSTPQQFHISSPLPSVKSRKSLMLSRGPEVKTPERLSQIQCQNTERATITQSSTKDPSVNTNITKQQQGQLQTSTESSDPAEHISPANTCYVGNYERNVFLPKCVVQRAGKMTRPSAAARHLLRHLFTAEELSQSSNNGNPTRHLKRLDPNKISAIRVFDPTCKSAVFDSVLLFTEWAVKRFPKFDLSEKGKDWKICLSVINSTTRYFRFMAKTRKQKMKPDETLPQETRASSGHTAEIDVELSDSDTEQMNRINSLPNYNSADASCYILDGSSPKQVHLGPPHREVKVPEFVLSAAHLRTRPELIARYLIKFIFPEDVLVRSNVYGARRGIQPLDHNKISALREYLSERFPWMKLEEDGSDWKVCVGAINSTIRKFRYEHKMGIRRKKR